MLILGIKHDLFLNRKLTEELDKEKKIQRTQKEIQKIESFFPYFKSFSSILRRKNFVLSELASTTAEHSTLQSDQDEWDRLDSSKGHINI